MTLPENIEDALAEYFVEGVQRRYKHFVETDDLENILALKDITTIEPEVMDNFSIDQRRRGYVSEMDARKLYKTIIETQWPYVETVERLETWQEVLGVEIKDFDVEMAFLTLVKKGYHNQVIYWSNQIDADISKPVVNRGYEILLEQKDFDMLPQWMEEAGEPEEELVQHAYAKYMVQSDYVAVNALQELTSVEFSGFDYMALVASVTRPLMRPHGKRGHHCQKKCDCKE